MTFKKKKKVKDISAARACVSIPITKRFRTLVRAKPRAQAGDFPEWIIYSRECVSKDKQTVSLLHFAYYY